MNEATERKQHFGSGKLGECCPGQRHYFSICKICGEPHRGDREIAGYYDHQCDFDYSRPTEIPHIGSGPATTEPLYVICDEMPGPEGSRFVELQDSYGVSRGKDVGATWEKRGDFAGLGPFYTELQVSALATRTAHLTPLMEALKALGHGADSGCSIEDCVGCAALKAAEEATS